MAQTDERYYAALLASTHGWYEAEHDAWPWLEFFVEQLARAYALFEERATSARGAGSKRDRVKDHVLRHAPARFAISDLRSALPGIGDGTIRTALDDLRCDGRVDSEPALGGLFSPLFAGSLTRSLYGRGRPSLAKAFSAGRPAAISRSRTVPGTA